MTAPGSSARAATGPGERTGFACRTLGTVVRNQTLGSLVWLDILAPGWPAAGPGQFALLRAEDSRCFLGRPLSVARQDGSEVSFLIAPVGEGTIELCRLRPGDSVWLLGPLGNGFDLNGLTSGPGRTVIVGGGVGVAPFPQLLATLGDAALTGAAQIAGSGRRQVLVLLGFRDEVQAKGAEPIVRVVEQLRSVGVDCRVEMVTEDGSLGPAKKVSDALQHEVRPGDRLAVCGPWAMTEAVARVCGEVADVEAWFSLEAGMACGVGSCHGCVIELGDGSMARVCREGPVFAGEALFRRGRLLAPADGRG